MAEGDRPTRYCGQCGVRLQEGDRFCGECGFAVLPPTPQADQVIPKPVAAAQGVARGGRRRRRALVNGAMISLMALLVVGGVAAFALGDGLGLLGGADRSPSNPSETPPAQEPDPAQTDEGTTLAGEPTEDASEPAGEPTTFSSDPAPDPAFDPLIPTLDGLTNAVIALPTDLPEGYDQVAIDEQSGEDSYTILFLNEDAPTDAVQPFTSAYVRGTLSAATGEGSELPAPVEGATETASGSVPVDGGLTADYACYDLDSPTSGRPYCTGGYTTTGSDGTSYVYQVTLEGEASPPEQETEQALSTMAVVMAQTSGGAEVEAFVSDYYEAVGREDWQTTYSMLAEVSQAEFTEAEWIEAQQTRQAQEGAPPPLRSVEAVNDGEFSSSAVVTFEDGSTTDLTILRYPQTGELGRLLSEEDVSYLRSLTGEETFAADEEAAVEETIRSHYEAIGEGDFEEAYSYFGPTFRAANGENDWIAEEESYDITDSTINSVEVVSVSGDAARAEVNVSFEDNTGTSEFYLGWNLVKEDGVWKLDQVSDGGATS